MENTEKQNKYLRAKERVEAMKKFYNNLTSYIIVNIFLFIINYWTNGLSYAWFLWVTCWWGLGLLFHAAKVFGWNPAFSKEWEERKIKEFMEKEEEDYKSSRWE
ncbi:MULTISPECIES: 2TM domain-containing protein [Galbibacter]|uniref:2TM domain-containing protein n=1 Tax=Galbibacter pacificus TaxID=2996052 RepID=A0ABT6FP55_9FLAO|nr:2TM domain-containing protein [Galbibacter pacificus]MDG3581566.1 2TM domain-containing protein [Galbibacter pacificus]MDG3585044.1 2TM domain-containing protein [Galbibacter pacificus]